MAITKSLKKTVNKSLESQAKENTTVTKGTKRDQKVEKQGTPLDHANKHKPQDTVVGVSLGVTKNMDNYESLRVDCWLIDTVKDGESVEQAYNRVVGVVDKQLQDTVQSYL